MELKNIFEMTKADKYTQDGRDELAKLRETEDVTYKTGDISQKTGLQKQPDGSWAPPKGGAKIGSGSNTNGMETNKHVKYLEQDLKQAKRTKAGPEKEFNIGYKILETLAGGTDAAFEAFKEAKKSTGSKEQALEQALNKYNYTLKETKAAGEKKPTQKRPKKISWNKENLSEIMERGEYVTAKQADNFYHQYGLDKIGEYTDKKGWTVKEYKNDDGESFRAKYDGEKYVGAEYDPSGEILSSEQKEERPKTKPTDEEYDIFKQIVREFRKSPSKKNEQIMNEAKAHLMKKGMTPEQLGKIAREVMAEPKDAAPRQLTGDTRIKVRK